MHVYIIIKLVIFSNNFYCDSREYMLAWNYFLQRFGLLVSLNQGSVFLWGNFIRTLGKMGIGGIGFICSCDIMKINNFN